MWIIVRRQKNEKPDKYLIVCTGSTEAVCEAEFFKQMREGTITYDANREYQCCESQSVITPTWAMKDDQPTDANENVAYLQGKIAEYETFIDCIDAKVPKTISNYIIDNRP